MKTPFSEDDFFKGSTMSFGEHLEELPACSIKGLYGLALGMLVGFLAAPYVVRFFKGPIEKGAEEYYSEKALIDLNTRFDGHPPIEMMNLIEEHGDGAGISEDRNLGVCGQPEGSLSRPVRRRFISPYTFIADDFSVIDEVKKLVQGVSDAHAQVPSAAKFAKRLKAESEGADDIAGKAIWEKLSDGERAIAARGGRQGRGRRYARPKTQAGPDTQSSRARRRNLSRPGVREGRGNQRYEGNHQGSASCWPRRRNRRWKQRIGSTS